MDLSTVHHGIQKYKKKKRVGRGIGSGHGKTSTRGSKGQWASAGAKKPTALFEGGQMQLFRRMPKRGFTNIFRVEYTVLNLDRISELNETELTLEKLTELGFTKRKGGLVKVLGNGELTTAVTVHAHKFSKTAQEKIEKAGGKAVLVS